MALVSCFDPSGKEYKKESVDARECQEHLGWSLAPREAEQVKPNVTFPAIENAIPPKKEKAWGGPPPSA